VLRRLPFAVALVAMIAPGVRAAAPAAAQGCNATPVIGPSVPAAATPVAQGVCPGVRPGAIVLMSGGQCTFNFVFRGSDRNTYIGTAGHCPLNGNSGDKRWSGYTGPYAADGSGRTIGHFVYAIYEQTGSILSPLDFALIRLNPGVRWSAQMCHFGGPDGMYTRHDPTPMVAEYFGNSPAYRSVLPARSAIVPDTEDANAIQAIGIAAHGDSGSGIINQAGEALGVMSEVIAPGVLAPVIEQPNGAIFSEPILFSRLDVGVARAQRVLRIRLTMVNAPVN
jgi:hypothetical protein